jgi:hypothetical protein
MNSLSVGTTLSIGASSIDVLGYDLELQPLRQGGVSFLAGRVRIDTEGNLVVGGNAEFAKDVTVRGNLAANLISPLPDQDLVINLSSSAGHEAAARRAQNLLIRGASNSAVLTVNALGDLVSSGSGTFNKLNLSFAKPALALSEEEVVATGSAGVATISARLREVTVRNSLVTDKSLIYVTPVGDTAGASLFLLRQVPGESFTVGVSRPVDSPLPFNFLIVN